MNIVTVDTDLGANPTIVAPFGLYSIAGVFGSKRFDRIIFEGTPGCGSSQFLTFSDVSAKDVCSLLTSTGEAHFDSGARNYNVTGQLREQALRSSEPAPHQPLKRKAAPLPEDVDDYEYDEKGLDALRSTPASKKLKTTQTELSDDDE